MTKRRFKTDLSVRGINNLKAELINYKKNILQSKIDLFTRRLAEDRLRTIYWKKTPAFGSKIAIKDNRNLC